MSDQVLVGSGDFWSQVEEAEKLGGGSGTFAKIEIQFGYKVFVSAADGLTRDDGSELQQSDSFFPYKIGDKDSMTDAQKKANKFVLKNGLAKNPSNVFMMRIIKESVIGKEVTWKGDRWMFYFLKGNSAWFYENFMKPKLKEAGITSMGEYYANVTWARDEGGKLRPKQDQEGNPVVDEESGEVEMEYPLQAYPAKIYASREEWLKDSGAEEINSNDAEAASDIPEGYDAETWAATVAEVKAELSKGTKAAKIAKDFDLTIEQVNSLK